MSQEQTDYSRAAEILQTHDQFHILIHAYPDGDTIGSGFALCHVLRSMGKQANVVCAHEIPKSYGYITGNYREQAFVPCCFVTVDVADLHLLGGEYSRYEGKVSLCVDHHASSHDFAEFSLANSTAAANCELIYRLIGVLGAEPDRYVANCIYTGISTDTGCFKYTNTSAATHRLAAEMMEWGADVGSINRVMFDTKSRCRFEIERLILDSMEFYCDGRVALICVTDEMRQKTGAADGDLEGITSLPRQVEGVLIGITLRQKGENNYKISIRSHAPVDAAAMCRCFGGGGHSCAAGCAMNGTLADIKRQIVSLCAEYLPNEK